VRDCQCRPRLTDISLASSTLPECWRASGKQSRANYDLTPHETRLLKLFVQGHNYKTAAAELGVSVHTVSFHLRSIYDKLQVHSKSEAVAKALQNRLV